MQSRHLQRNIPLRSGVVLLPNSEGIAPPSNSSLAVPARVPAYVRALASAPASAPLPPVNRYRPLQEAHRSDLQLMARAGLRRPQVVHIHDGQEVRDLGLKYEVGLMPAAVFDLRSRGEVKETHKEKSQSHDAMLTRSLLPGDSMSKTGGKAACVTQTPGAFLK